MRDFVEQLIRTALEAAQDAGEVPAVDVVELGVERPNDPTHGDWASSVALRISKPAKMNPHQIADAIAEQMGEDPAVATVEVAGPGFINIRLSDSAYQNVFADIRTQGDAYGRSKIGTGTKVDLEFVSANPTGPMHIGHGRWAALGDAIANVLEYVGYDVTREFYINDAGRQMDIFAASVSCRYLQIMKLVASGSSVDEACQAILSDMDTFAEELPKDCYAGAYVVDIAADICKAEGDRWVDADSEERDAFFKERAYQAVLGHVSEVLHDFGLDFDVWFSERTLHEVDDNGQSAISRVVAELDEKGYLYEKEGARWFKTTAFGDDKDRVLVKADGDYTYFAPDIAYHKDKFDRGFTRCIDLLGADHHGYIKRIQSVGQVFDHPGQPEVIIGQMVNLFRNGEVVRMSKRTGEMVTFEELIDEVGVDATRYLMLSRSTDQTIDFDIAEAKKQDSSNPVYYVQYAHARICSILRKAADVDEGHPDDLVEDLIPADADLSLLSEESELDLAHTLEEFGETVEGCARDLAPFRLTHYAERLAADFHRFYTRCQVLCDDCDLRAARLCVVDATRLVLRSTLALLGVSAPERM
ncbi:MAG: arginine--tRNA ligase [Coriobacteriaceae bacterium]|nr:arginine--tRNA ligase [Coriobacteriaceae bacterium]